MEGNEFIVPIVAIVFGTAFGIIFLYFIFSTIKAWIERNKSGVDGETFDRFAQAFIEYKKETDRRLQNLEAIVTDHDEDEYESIQGKLDEPEKSVDMEEEPPRKKEHTESGNLKNILKE